MLTYLDLGSCAIKILDVINIVIPIRKTVSLRSQRDITIISTASPTGEIYRGYYTVAPGGMNSIFEWQNNILRMSAASE